MKELPDGFFQAVLVVRGDLPLDPAVVRKALADAENGRAGTARNNGSLLISKKESDQSVLYVTADRAAEGAWLHKSYIAK